MKENIKEIQFMIHILLFGKVNKIIIGYYKIIKIIGIIILLFMLEKVLSL